MQSSTKIIAMLVLLLPLTSLATGGVPVAKYSEKLKVIDSHKKSVGFLEDNDVMNFKAGSFRFSVSVAKDGFHGQNQKMEDLYYEDQACSGTPLIKSTWISSNNLRTDVLLITGLNGYAVFAADIDAGAVGGSVVQGVKQVFGGCNPINIYPGLVNNSDTFYRSKQIATLPYIPPFSLR